MTFSLAGRCARTGMLGAVVTTSSLAVGARCCFARAGVGAVLSQHFTDPRLGPMALDLLARGETAEAARDIFNADIVEYAGAEEAKAEYPSLNGVPVDLVFSRHSNVYDVLDHFDLGICRAAWDGEFMLTDDFANDLGKRTITSFYPSPRGHGKRVLDKLAPLGFHMGEQVVKDDYVAGLRERAERRGYRLMHRRNGQYWLMRHQPMTLHEVAEFLYP